MANFNYHPFVDGSIRSETLDSQLIVRPSYSCIAIFYAQQRARLSSLAKICNHLSRSTLYWVLLPLLLLLRCLYSAAATATMTTLAGSHTHIPMYICLYCRKFQRHVDTRVSHVPNRTANDLLSLQLLHVLCAYSLSFSLFCTMYKAESVFRCSVIQPKTLVHKTISTPMHVM